MAILTCRNHPNLRWSCKDLAVTDGRYNGARSLFFNGEPDGTGMYSDGSGLNCSEYLETRNEAGEVTGYRIVRECDCAASELILAPEDALVKRG